MREERREVLVVGAGPVGLWTALKLSLAGVEPLIVDSENRIAARSYACALHPSTLSALHRVGLAESLIEKGRKIDTVAFYDGETRCGEVSLARAGGEFPFLLIVPQSAFESALEERLEKSGVRVHWMHRLDSFSREEEGMSVLLEELSGTTTSYVVPHWETRVRRQIPMSVQFIVGADGQQSITRRRMRVDYQLFSGPDTFAAYEFESDEPAASEVRVVLGADNTSVLWPLPGNKWRWTFQMAFKDQTIGFPEKEREAVRLLDTTVDDRLRDYVQRVAAQRAPWFKAAVKDVTWCTKVPFEQRLVNRFGLARCWLLGDAAHQTGPVGIQSMNSGIAEGEMLAGLLKRVIHENEDLELLETYNTEQQNIWQRLVRPGMFKADLEASRWVAGREQRLTSCLPGLASNLDVLAAQVGLSNA